ncbi:MAG: HipA domain-containing protein [Persicimonas sp.]
MRTRRPGRAEVERSLGRVRQQASRAQHKASVILTDSGYALPGSGEASTHILKFDSSRFPHLTANEFLVTRFAAELGIEVVESHLDDRTTPPLLVVERYDRHSNGSATRRVHQEDFCQILGLLPAQKYEKEGGPTLARIATALRSVSARPALDILRLVRWVILCALCGNADGHAKNLSVLYGASGPTLAPAYDLVCTRAFPNLHRELAFAIGGEHNSDRILRENWEIFAEDIGVRPRRVISEVAQMVADAPEAFERAVEQLREQIGASHAVQHVSPAVHKRIRALQTHL